MLWAFGALIGLLVFYWIIRQAVRDAIVSARSVPRDVAPGDGVADAGDGTDERKP